MRIVRSFLLGLGLITGMALILPALALAAILLGGAWLTRALAELATRQRASVPWQELVEYEPVVGWRPKANLDTFGRADDIFHLTTDGDGWRSRVRVEDADVVVFGDSFAFGHGADDDRMFPAFARGVRIKPIGSDGYDMVHGLLWMERLSPKLSGKLIVWFAFYGNDLWENLLPATGHYRKPFVRQHSSSNHWEVITEHVGPEPWPFPTARNYHEPLAEICCSGSHLNRRVAESCRFLVGRANALCTSVDAELVVVGIPDRVQLTKRGQGRLRHLAPESGQFDVNEPDELLRRACNSAGVAFLPLSQHLAANDYLVQDIHWRTSGHQKVGRLLSELVIHRQE